MANSANREGPLGFNRAEQPDKTQFWDKRKKIGASIGAFLLATGGITYLNVRHENNHPDLGLGRPVASAPLNQGEKAVSNNETQPRADFLALCKDLISKPPVQSAISSVIPRATKSVSADSCRPSGSGLSASAEWEDSRNNLVRIKVETRTDKNGDDYLEGVREQIKKRDFISNLVEIPALPGSEATVQFTGNVYGTAMTFYPGCRIFVDHEFDINSRNQDFAGSQQAALDISRAIAANM